MILYMFAYFVLCCLIVFYLYWRFSLCFVSFVRVNCYIFTIRRVKEVIFGFFINCFDVFVVKVVVVFVICIYVYICSFCFRFFGIKSYGLFVILRLKYSNYLR